jgi:tetratricopeptide (TPR) repeat protein
MIAAATRAFLVAVCVCLIAYSAGGQSSGNSATERYAEEGQSALAAGRLDDAEKAYEKLRELEPGVAEVHANLGMIYFQQGRYEQAVPALRQALKLKPSLTRTESLLSVSLSELGRYKDAAPGLEKCLHRAADPEIKRMCGLQLQRAYGGLGRDRNAVEVALELNRLYPDDPEVLYHTGKVYGNYAFLTMQKLAQVAPASVWRHQTLAEADESQGSYDAAITEYRQVLALDPRRPGIHYRLGRTLLARARETTSAEDLASAQREFEQELALDPLNGNAAYEMAEARRNGGQFEEAQKLFEQALNSHPDFEEAQLGLASVLMSQQKPQQALPHLRKAIELNQENEVSWYRLSQVQRSLGNSKEAQDAFAKYQQLHQQKASLDEAGKRFLSPSEVTRQQVDSNAPQ